MRSPATLARPATLRWMAGATACLALFWAVSTHADRLGRLYLVWGCVVAAFFFNTAFGVVQVGCQSSGLFGLLQPGNGPFWAPSLDDLATTPTTTLFRTLGGSGAHPAWATAIPERPFLFGSLMGGPGAYLALAALGLPLALAIILQLVAPRGSRETLRMRLSEAGQGSLVLLLCGMLLASAILVGLMAGPMGSVPFAIGLALVGLPAAWPTGVRWTAIGLTVVALLFLGGGVVLGELWSRLPESRPPFAPVRLAGGAEALACARAIAVDFPIVGTGLGSFSAIGPFYKTSEATTTTAQSSLIQWWVESGLAGLVLLLLAAVWCLCRLPGAVRRVGTADRSLVFGLIGAATSFTLFSAVHWTVELGAVALAASAWGGTWNRWLAGGTDLFVERG
jgi:hypothetical protein